MTVGSDQPVLVCYDGSDGAGRAVELAAGMFAGRPACVLCVWESVWAAAMAPPFAGFPGELVEETDRAVATRAREVAAKGAELLPGSEPLAVKASGSTWQTILEVATTHHAAVIVVGSRGLGGLRSAILGSVSHGLVNHSHRPVLVVPPE